MLLDAHIHAEKDVGDLTWHGKDPRTLARSIAKSPLDAAILLGHNCNVADNPRGFLRNITNVKAELAQQGRGQIIILMAVEVSAQHEGVPLHIGFVYEADYHDQNLPDIPASGISVEALAQAYRNNYDGVLLLYHPTENPLSSRDQQAVQELMASGLIQGVELLNAGSIHHRRRCLDQIVTGARLFLEARERMPHLAALGSSDEHFRTRYLGKAATHLESTDREGIFDAIRTGQTRAVSHQLFGPVPRVVSEIMKLPRGRHHLAHQRMLGFF